MLALGLSVIVGFAAPLSDPLPAAATTGQGLKPANGTPANYLDEGASVEAPVDGGANVPGGEAGETGDPDATPAPEVPSGPEAPVGPLRPLR